jgi:hypothetical protein
MQNKANFQELKSSLSVGWKVGYEPFHSDAADEKQSQFTPEVSSFKWEVSSGHPALQTSHFTLPTFRKTPAGFTASRPRCPKQSQFPGAQMDVNNR